MTWGKVTEEPAAFLDRAGAGRQLATLLEHLRSEDPVVVALPRGGVAVGCEIARALRAPLDILVARKLGAPGQNELGIGAIAPGGVRVLDELAVNYLRIPAEEVERIACRETEEMERRERLYRGERPKALLAGRTVILVDDGLATGVTARAAVRSVRLQGPRRIVLAAPVCAAETASAFRDEVDELVCVSMPYNFRAVGYWYLNFDQLTDEEVIELLNRANSESVLSLEP